MQINKNGIKKIVVWLQSSKTMQKSGITLVYAGALLLTVSFFIGMTNTNFLLFLYLLMIIFGIIIHVAGLKRQSRY